MDGRDLLHLEHVAGEEGDDEQHDGDEERPCREELLLRRVALCVRVVSNLCRGCGCLWEAGRRSVVGSSNAPSGSDSSASRPANAPSVMGTWTVRVGSRRTEELEAHVGDVGGGQHRGRRAARASGPSWLDTWRLRSRLKPHGGTGAGSMGWRADGSRQRNGRSGTVRVRCAALMSRVRMRRLGGCWMRVGGYRQLSTIRGGWEVDVVGQQQHLSGQNFLLRHQRPRSPVPECECLEVCDSVPYTCMCLYFVLVLCASYFVPSTGLELIASPSASPAATAVVLQPFLRPPACQCDPIASYACKDMA